MSLSAKEILKELKTLPDLLAALQARGFRMKTLLIDGRWHKFQWADTEKKKGQYRAIETSHGIDFQFTNWKDRSLDFNFTFSLKEMSPADLLEHQKRIAEFLEAEERRQQIKWDTAKIEVERLWNISKEDADHPYLKNKKIKNSYGTRVSPTGILLIPAYDIEGILWGIQMISDQGNKSNISNCKMKGCVSLVGEILPEGPLFICEGFATAISVFEATEIPTICAFSSLFFVEAGKQIKKKYPKIELIFAGDADAVGKKSSRKAAQILKASCLVPEFKSPHPDYTDWNDLREIQGEGDMKNQLSHFRDEIATFPEAQFLKESIEELAIEVDIDSSLTLHGENKSIRQIASAIRLRSCRLKENLKRGFVEDFLCDWHPREASRVRNEFLEKFFEREKIDPSLTLLRSFMRAFIRRDDELALQAIHQFLWQVKRKMRGLPVEHHLMPIFTGLTGKGKSMAINRFLSPLKCLYGVRSLSLFNDERVWTYFESHFVVFFDEMAKAVKHDAEMLKMVVSATDFDIEPKYEGLRRVKQNCTFIGATNFSMESVIMDETSNRRFFDIHSDQDTDRAVINSIDYLELWQSIDEESECPIAKVILEVKAAQDLSRNQSPLEVFLNEFDFKKTDEDVEKVGILNTDLLQIFEDWRKKHGFDSWNNTRTLGIELKRLGFKKFRSHSKTGFFLHSEILACAPGQATVFEIFDSKPL